MMTQNQTFRLYAKDGINFKEFPAHFSEKLKERYNIDEINYKLPIEEVNVLYFFAHSGIWFTGERKNIMAKIIMRNGWFN